MRPKTRFFGKTILGSITIDASMKHPHAFHFPTSDRGPRAMARSRPLVAGLVILSAFSCEVPLDSSDSSIPFDLVRVGNGGDTIAPFGSLSLRFTHPVASPDSVRFVFQPPYTDCLVSANATEDTLTLQFMVPLQGETRYSIHLRNQVSARDGSLLFPSDDSIVVFTAAAEQEPNDFPSSADTLTKKIFGTISAADDTDWFSISDTTMREFYLISHGPSSQFDIRDANGAVIVKPSLIAAAETLTVPSNAPNPRYLVVTAWNRSNGGYYELGGK
jgi:hypothetical protein